jgi:hypothetical protein
MHYTDSITTWQAYAVMMVDWDCIQTGKFPNGSKMTAVHITETKEEIERCKSILQEHGCAMPVLLDEERTGQLKMFV